MATSNFLGKPDNEWIVDTSATNYITHDVTPLAGIKLQHNIPPMQIPKGKIVPVSALREITLGKKLVLGILDFCFNLLLASKLTRDMSQTFWPNCFVIQDLPSEKLIGAGRELDGLYYLDPVKEGELAWQMHQFVHIYGTNG